MTDRKKTREEYEATAMLLGMIYDEQINTFYRLGGASTDVMNIGGTVQDECDADTMELLSAEAVNDRYIASAKTEDIASYDHGDGW